MPIRLEYHAKRAASAMKFISIIFDLDGTLVDSAPGILMSLGYAMNVTGITPARALTPDVIGPPLADTLRALCPQADAATLAAVTAAFKQHYDTEGCLQTRPFEGITELLDTLSDAGYPMFVATNKRYQPTQQIIHYLGLAPYFVAVYSLDSIHPSASSKGALLRYLLAKHGLPAVNTLYVGDRSEDKVAAQQASMPFFLADWGYGIDKVPDTQKTEKIAMRSIVALFENSR